MKCRPKRLMQALAMTLAAAVVSSPRAAVAVTLADASETRGARTVAAANTAQAPVSAEPETPPAPEYPYPGAADSSVSPSSAGASSSGTKSIEPSEPAPERPIRQSEDGEYFYDTKLQPVKPLGHDGVIAPKKTTESGEYDYGTVIETPTPPPHADGSGPDEVLPSGEYRYHGQIGKTTRSSSFRFGAMSAPDLTNNDTGATFSQIYTANNLFIFFLDYEWKLTQRAGHLGLKFTSGFFSAQGKGTFLTQNPNRRPYDTPIEQFSLLAFPNQFTLIDSFQFSDEQSFVPFIEGGAGYFTMAELRNDGKAPKFGGAAVAVGAVGVKIFLDNIDRRQMRLLSDDYGINHVWLAIEYRRFQGLNSTFDFTSNVVDAGFVLDF